MNKQFTSQIKTLTITKALPGNNLNIINLLIYKQKPLRQRSKTNTVLYLIILVTLNILLL